MNDDFDFTPEAIDALSRRRMLLGLGAIPMAALLPGCGNAQVHAPGPAAHRGRFHPHAAPHVTTIAASLRPEKLDWVGDEPGFGTLPYSRDSYTNLIAPSGVVANVVGAQVSLSWWGSARARSYNVKRASSASGPFSTIASITDPRTYTDSPARGAWYYAVTSVGDAGESLPSSVVRVATAPELLRATPFKVYPPELS